MKLKDFEKELLKNPKIKKELNKFDLAFEVGEMLIEARVLKGITQEKLAKMIKTHQSGIARAENGSHLPSLSFLQKIAHVLHTHIILRFAFMEKDNLKLDYKPTNTKQDQNKKTYSILTSEAKELEPYYLYHTDTSSQNLASVQGGSTL